MLFVDWIVVAGHDLEELSVEVEWVQHLGVVDESNFLEFALDERLGFTVGEGFAVELPLGQSVGGLAEAGDMGVICVDGRCVSPHGDR